MLLEIACEKSHRSLDMFVRHVPEAKPADHLAETEVMKLLELLTNGGDAAKAGTICLDDGIVADGCRRQ